jgi:hypothetical protein
MRSSLRICAGRAAAALVTVSLAPASTAADARSGKRSCLPGYSVGLSTSTTAYSNHAHNYTSDAGYTKSFTTNYAPSLGSHSLYRGASWTASTQGFFASVTSSCLSDPL